MTDKKCADLVHDAFASRMEDIRKMYMSPNRRADLGDGYEIPLNEYGLSIDYVQAHTFGDEQKEGYWRYQISWGGPSEEFRWYRTTHNPRVEFWYLDWYDGARVPVEGVDATIIQETIKETSANWRAFA